jgi:hypothetical protein
MAELTAQDLLKVTRNAYKRVNPGDAKRVDIKKRPWIRMLESIGEDTSFEGGAILYPIQTSFNDPGTTWSGDQEIEAHDPDFSLNLEYGYFNYTTAITIKHDMLVRLGFTVKPNSDGLLEDRAMSKDQAFKIQDYVKNLVRGFKDNHDKYLDRLLLRSGAASSTDPVGLFGILTEDPTTGNVGGLSRATYTQLRHIRQTGLTVSAAGDFRDLWDTALRSANQFSHSNGIDGAIDWYMAGSAFIRGYKNWGEANGYDVRRDVNEKLKTFDFAIPDEVVQYEGKLIVWNPSMDDLDSVDTFSPTCTKLCVGVNKSTWAYKRLRGKYKTLTSPADPPKQRVTREDIDTTAHIACKAPASNLILAID